MPRAVLRKTRRNCETDLAHWHSIAASGSEALGIDYTFDFEWVYWVDRVWPPGLLESQMRSTWFLRAPFFALLGALALTNASGCSSSDPSDDCASRKQGATCSRLGLLCGIDSCEVGQCDEGSWCTAIVPTGGCSGPTPPAGFCPAEAPATGTPCSATNGTTCAYGCPEGTGTVYTACNSGVFCTVYNCQK